MMTNILFLIVMYVCEARMLQDISDCERSCMNGDCAGVLATDVKCVCREGWVGPDCDTACTYICYNGGTCISLSEYPDDQGCNCTSRWRSIHCETPCREADGVIDCSPFPSTAGRDKLVQENRQLCDDNCVNGTCQAIGLNFTCKCFNTAMWIGEWCETRCPCLNNGWCIATENGTDCNCPKSHPGPLCNGTAIDDDLGFRNVTHVEEVRIPSEDDALWPILLGCLFGLVGLLAAVCLLLYLLWRRRIIWVMKMKYFFQPSEESDGRTYDAFVSYCGCGPDQSQSEDEQFVIYKLRQKLEDDLGYSLCLHQRDFIPGEAIADNIILAVDNSRRTILVLSHRYVNSEWCKLEYNVAHQEMLKLQHRIIPVMLENPDDIPVREPILEKILKNITYIRYPGEENEKKLDHFWKRIQYSMPKKPAVPALPDERLEVPREELELDVF